MDEKTFAEVHATMQNPPSWKELALTYEARAKKAEKKLEALELVASYAKDVIDFWPSMTFRTVRVMMPKMAALKEALELVR